MKAAVLKAIGEPFAIEDVPDPEPGPDEVLIETRTCGICRTDLHIQDGLAYVPSLPHIPGHEPAGVVIEVGAEVSGIAVGQRVVPHLFVRSGECCYSRAGHDAQALHSSGIIGVTLPGGFAERFTAPARNLLEIPETVDFDAAGLTSCAAITAVHAYRLASLQLGDSAVVLGAGGIGLMIVELLARAGVRVVGVARSDESLRLAAKAGAELTVSSQDAGGAAEQIRAFSRKDGVDCVFEMVGLASTMGLAAACARRLGTVIVIGEEAEFPAIDTIQIAQRELRIIGSRNGGRQDAIDALDLMARGIIQPVIAARYPLESINEAMETVRAGGVHGRVIVTSGPAVTRRDP